MACCAVACSVQPGSALGPKASKLKTEILIEGGTAEVVLSEVLCWELPYGTLKESRFASLTAIITV